MIYPSVYMSEKIKPNDRVRMVSGRVKESMRLSKQSRSSKKPKVIAYYRCFFTDTQKLLSKVSWFGLWKVGMITHNALTFLIVDKCFFLRFPERHVWNLTCYQKNRRRWCYSLGEFGWFKFEVWIRWSVSNLVLSITNNYSIHLFSYVRSKCNTFFKYLEDILGPIAKSLWVVLIVVRV